MSEYKEDKFIVINRKHIEELKEYAAKNPEDTGADKSCCLMDSLQNWNIAYRSFLGKELNQSYYVCNQDEPYAQKVIDVILEGEAEKEREFKKNAHIAHCSELDCEICEVYRDGSKSETVS